MNITKNIVHNAYIVLLLGMGYFWIVIYKLHLILVKIYSISYYYKLFF